MSEFEDAGLARVRIVLVGVQHPGNVGAVARAMKVMGLSDLALAAPECFPHPDAEARASGATDVLDSARIYDRFDEAIGDCALVIGTSARTRRIGWPRVNPRQAARQALSIAANAPVAIAFGCERSGLDNAALDRCQYHLQIPANPDYASLNLAAAVQIVAYELRVAGCAGVGPGAAYTPASVAEMEGLYGHIESALYANGFLRADNPGVLMRRVRRLFNRAAPDRSEVNILRGALRALAGPGRQRNDKPRSALVKSRANRDI